LHRPDASETAHSQGSAHLVHSGAPNLAALKGELALWRAFLGDEIDTILRDKG
jgi:hypothetical protein